MKPAWTPWAASNLQAYLREQQEATSVVPSDRTLVVERFRDELGDWRVVLHSPFGMPVHAPWALAVGARLHARYGLDGSAMASDDGIVLRVPMMEDEPPGAELFLFDADELDAIVTNEVGGSALFASRFRECAARALLLPRQNPAKRSPLWQQRQRSAQLLDVARKYPSFPIILETVRECLQDVYDLPALRGSAADIEARKLRVVETTTPPALAVRPVPAVRLRGPVPLRGRLPAGRAPCRRAVPGPRAAERPAGPHGAARTAGSQVIADTEAQLQRLTPDRQLKGLEGTADLLRLLVPLTMEEIAARVQRLPSRRSSKRAPAGEEGG